MNRTSSAFTPLRACIGFVCGLAIVMVASAAPRPDAMADGYITGRVTSDDGPETLDGTHCEQGWTLFRTDGPTFQGTDVPADFHYFGWVDQHNVSGFGHDTPIATGSNSDALLVLDPDSGDWTKLRVPYPLGFYHRGLDGRIDDPDGGWKGRGLWANYGSHLIWHTEGGLGTLGKAVRFQVRPDPLAF